MPLCACSCPASAWNSSSRALTPPPWGRCSGRGGARPPAAPRLGGGAGPAPAPPERRGAPPAAPPPVGLEHVVGDVDAEVALGLDDGDPELTFEGHLALGRP